MKHPNGYSVLLPFISLKRVVSTLVELTQGLVDERLLLAEQDPLPKPLI